MTEQIESLVNALTTEPFEQTQGKLRAGNAFCCLGVACEVYRRANPDNAKWNENAFVVQGDEHENTHALPDEVAKYFGFTLIKGAGYSFASFDEPVEDNRFNNLAALNDFANWTLKQIGDFIKTNPKGLIK